MTDEHMQVKFLSESCEINYSSSYLPGTNSSYRKQLSLFSCLFFFLPGPSIVLHGLGKVCLDSLWFSS